MARDLDWRSFLNRLVYCYGCGRFGVPASGKMPEGWSTLYQPHDEGPPALPVCGDACKSDVQEAIKKRPVLEPLRMAKDVMMPAEMRKTMMAEAMAHAMKEEGLLDQLFSEAVRGEPENDGDG